jgi:hypothetical protein
MRRCLSEGFIFSQGPPVDTSALEAEIKAQGDKVTPPAALGRLEAPVGLDLASLLVSRRSVRRRAAPKWSTRCG